MKKILGIFMTLALFMTFVLPVSAEPTTVPGQTGRYDADNNNYPDAGKKVTGKYTSVYAYDSTGAYYWDLGDGRVQGNVDSLEDLDKETLTRCDYQNQYRADFGNDPFMDSGWIINSINCKGVEKGHWTYLIVHESDPRYTGNPDWAVWDYWEYHVLSESGNGNLVHATPEHAVGL